MHLTKNMGTAAYMAPELTSLVGYSSDFPPPDDNYATSQKDDLETHEQQIQAQHGAGLDKFELSSTPPSPDVNSLRKFSSVVHTERDLAPKVGAGCASSLFPPTELKTLLHSHSSHSITHPLHRWTVTHSPSYSGRC